LDHAFEKVTLVNQAVSHYKIISLLGEGGMGEVYLARDTKLGRDVAVKVLPAAFSADAERLRRFEQEAQAAGALNHPNILVIFHIGTHEGAPYIVSELLEGETLRERIGGTALPQRKAVDYALQIVHGLAAAHAKGIVHRDLKPENIFVTNGGFIKILDFGLAKFLQAKAEIDTEAPTMRVKTDPGRVMGTVAYMSPEQVRGQSALVDHRSDVFAFGAVLYEMLTGKQAFKGESVADTMSAILNNGPPELSIINSNLSRALDRIIHRCLEKHPEERFQLAIDVGYAIEALAEVSGPSTSAIAAEPLKAKRSWQVSPVIIVIGLAVLLVGIVAGIFVGRRTGTLLSPSYQRLTFSRGTIWNARFAPDGQTVVYSGRWNGHPLDIFSGRAGKIESRSLKLENADLLAISASNEMAVLVNRQHLGWFISRGTLARMPVDGGSARDLLDDVQEADWSPDGTKLAVVRWVNGRNRLEYPVGKVLYETAGYISHPRISPKGDLVAFMDHQVQWDNRGWVAVVDFTGKKTVLSGEWQGEEGLAWSPAGDEVWFTADRAGEADALYAVTLSGRERLVVRMASHLTLHDISRDGHVLITSYNDSQNIISQPPGETKERDLSWLDQEYLSDLSPDGQTILFDYEGEGAGNNYAVYLRQTDGSPAVRLGDGAPQRLSPDGKWALTVLFAPPQLVLLPTGAGEARSLERGPIEQYSYGAGWFPDGKQVVFQGREPGRDWRCYIQSIEGGPPRPITPEGAIGTLQGNFFISPDGRLVIAPDAQHQQSFYPVEGGAPQPISHLESADEIIGWSSDGRSLYLARTEEMPIRVYRFDPLTGRRELLKEVLPADPAGIFWPNHIFMTPDGKGYVYSVRRVLSDLYVAEGLK
jgi:serine/threonine protein kinase/Tol biopolymer transport system component